MTIDDKIRDQKLQNNINREPAKISALLSGKIDKYECLISEETLPFYQRRVTEQLSLHVLLQEKLQKNKKTNGDQGREQADTITNKNEVLLVLTNKDSLKDNY